MTPRNLFSLERRAKRPARWNSSRERTDNRISPIVKRSAGHAKTRQRTLTCQNSWHASFCGYFHLNILKHNHAFSLLVFPIFLGQIHGASRRSNWHTPSRECSRTRLPVAFVVRTTVRQQLRFIENGAAVRNSENAKTAVNREETRDKVAILQVELTPASLISSYEPAIW